MCDFRGDPTAIYLIHEDKVIPIDSVGWWHPGKEDLLAKPAGMYHSHGVTGCAYYYTNGTRRLTEYNGYFPPHGCSRRGIADYVPLYSGQVDYWGMGSPEDIANPPEFLSELSKHGLHTGHIENRGCC